ncbi:Dihydroneopterin aldolase [Arcticibacter svalbardensis MN12-7]|uniref:7,8-dihydroneopterin aldolase n=1 Tax=Arcticibacter svalbardensis MN12-7 TaxID=1150600 RepID=R9GPE3_9SPHI|nr:dihydroneopterin aldolase [Arcticibacter svalbardensis]EOR93687.1 Dihydroneopterin aldolase [Arcticibacter svalbardensis MN12-7]
MSATIKTISLEGIRFFSFHGFFPEEQILGTPFLVDVLTEMNSKDDDSDDLNLTVNYGRLFEITEEEMKIPRKLLEKVASSILNRIKHEFPELTKISVIIKKLTLPVRGEMQNAKVMLTYTR